MNEILRRLNAPTPKFWKKFRNTMIAVGAVSATIIGLPVALPATIITLASYGVAVGAVGATLAQLTEEKK